MAGNTATPWGRATVVDEVKVSQRAGQKTFATVLQLLSTGDGENLVRIAYTTDGIARRGPVTLRPRDIAALRRKLRDDSPLASALGWSGREA